MTTPNDLNVRTVYASEPPEPPPPPRSPVARSRIRIVGLLSLVVAMAWIYVTWFPVDRFLVRAMIKAALAQPFEIDWSFLYSTPPPEKLPADRTVEPDAPTDILAPPHTPESTPADERPGTTGKKLPRARRTDSPRPPPRTTEPTGEAAPDGTAPELVMERLTYAMYAWLTDTTVVAAWLALCGGAGLGGVFLGRRTWETANLFLIAAAIILTVVGGLYAAQQAADLWTYDLPKPPPSAEVGFALAVLLCVGSLCTYVPRPAAVVLVVLTVAALAGLIAYTWAEYERVYPAGVPRVLVMLVFLGAALTGVLLHRKAGLLQGIAVVLVLISAGVTVAAMAYGEQYGALVEIEPTTVTYVKAFALQASYAVAVLILRLGLR